MKPIHLLFPMSGQGTRYQKVGYQQPKPLIPVSGVPMIERLLEVFPKDWPCTFVIAENHQATDLPLLLQKLRPGCRIVAVPVHNEGPALAIRAGLNGIASDERILVSYCDYGMIWDAQSFDKFTQETNCDAALLSYIGFHAHYLSPVPYAYSRLEGDQVVEVREKGSFTSNREEEYASSGGYYFRDKATLQEALEFQTAQDLKMNNEFYTSLTVQALLLKNPKAQVRVFKIPYFFQWGTPQDLWDFEYWEKTFKAAKKSEIAVEQVLMPMAGLGSRFKKLTAIPKPFIPVRGTVIFQRALDSLPQAPVTQIVALTEHQKYLEKQLVDQKRVTYLDQTPAGQALTTQAGVGFLDLTKSVLVSSCDHELFISKDRWEQVLQLKPDAVIFTVRNFPGTRRSPNSFAFVETEAIENPISPVKSVSVKKPISDSPARDPMLVGTFWFKSAGLLQQGIELLKKDENKVNGELYLDGIFNFLLSEGKKVHVCEAEGYINWGDPESMAEALYWSEVYQGPLRDRRSRYAGVFE